MCLQSTIHCAKVQKRKILHKYKRKIFYDFHGRLVGMMGESQSISGGIGRVCEGGIGRYEIKKSNSDIELLFIRRRRHTLPQQV